MAELFVVVVLVIVFWSSLKVLSKATNKVLYDASAVATSHSAAFRRESAGGNYASLPTAVRRAGYNPDMMEVYEMMTLLDTISALDLASTEEEVMTVLSKLRKFSQYKAQMTPTPTQAPAPTDAPTAAPTN